jgi:hypothetical protein
MKAPSASIFSSLRKSFFALSVLILSAAVTHAQAGRGGISGTVTDPSGAIVPKATVVAVDTAKGTKLSTTSTGAGVYSFISLGSGTYEITVSRDGFDKVVQKNVNVTVDQTTQLNITLHAGGVSETVTVDASAASLLDSSNSTVGQLISAQTIDRVPLVSRDVYELVQLSAGVLPANGTPNAADTPGIFNARSLADVASYTVNGALQGNSYYMIDGSPIGIAENNSGTIIPAFQIPEDGVEEFRVETQNTPASYASGGGGVISLVTKSGTNAFHGDAFGYFRPSALAANDYFYKQNNPGASTPDFHRYQEGGAISGPIIKDKLFFFGDYEATQQEALEVGSFTVPTVAERGGDFSADTGLAIYNPLVPDSTNVNAQNGQIERQPFANNIIPTADLNPIALKFAAQYPLPNHADDGNPQHTNNYKSSGLDPQNAQKFDVRIDYALNDKNRIFGRFSYGRLTFGNADLYGNEYDPYYYVNVTNTRNGLIGYDRTLSSTSVLQLRGSFTRHFEDQTGDPRQNNFDITSLGFPQALADQVVFKQIPVITLGDTTAIGGTGNYDTFIFASENADVSATLTKILGKHELSTGFEYQKKFMNVGQPPAPAGTYGFDTTGTSSTAYNSVDNTGSDFASFLLGIGSVPGGEGGNFTKDIFAAESNPYYAAFLQDNYHVTPKLTVNLGLRWDIFGGRNERHNRQEYFDPNIAYNVNGVALTGGEVFADSNHRSPFKTNLGDFGPRASFAWQTAPHVVFRGGAGIYYGPSSEMVANATINGDGFSSSTNWNATVQNANGNTVILNSLSNPFPNGVIQPLGAAAGPATLVGTSSGLQTVLHSPHTLTTYNFNFGVEVEFPGNTIFSLGYVGSRGLYLPLGTVDLNQLPLQTIQQYGTSLCVTGGDGCVMVPNTIGAALTPDNQFYGSDTIPQYLALEQFPQFGGGNYGSGVGVNAFPGADSEFSSLQAKVEKHMSHHVSSIASFTWGKIMTDDSQPPFGFVGYRSGAPQDAKNLNLEHAVSAQDVKLQFNWQVSYDLPIGKGRALNLESPVANSLLGGWTINSIAYLSDGVPIAAPSGTGSPYFNQRVNLNCNPAAHALHTASQWFNYTCFSQPTSQFVPGTAPAFLSSIRTDGAHQLDLSLYKNFALGKERNIRLEIASYNVTNSVQYGYPSVFWNPDSVNDPTVMAGFGQITSAANQPRQFQFGGRFTF